MIGVATALLILFAPSSAGAGPLEAVSGWINQLISGKCDEKNSYVAELAERARVCGPKRSHVDGLRQLADRIVDEDSYLAALSAARADDLKCDHDKLSQLFVYAPPARMMFAPPTPPLPQPSPVQQRHFSGVAAKMSLDAAQKVMQIRALNRQIHDAELKAKQANRSVHSSDLRGAERAEAVRKNYEEAERLRLAQQLIASSIPMAHFPRVQNVIDMAVGPTGAAMTEFHLADRIEKALRDQRDDLNKEHWKYRRASRGNSPKDYLNTTHLNSLAKDTQLAEEVLGLSPQRTDAMARVACEVNARYGQGRDRVDTSLAVGSLFVSGGAFGLVRGFAMARNAGLITNAARAQKIALAGPKLRAAGLAVDLASLGSIVDRKCLGVGEQAIFDGRGKGDCSAGNLLKDADHTSCIADAALTALGLTAWRKTGPAANNPQVHLWSNLENGKTEAASDLQRLIQSTLTEKEPVAVKAVGTGVNGAMFVRFENGIQGVWKGTSGSSISNSRKEIAAYKVDQELGLNIVPVTLPRTLNGVEGSIQLRVTDLERGGINARYRTGDPVDMKLFDALISHGDRHLGNWLRTRDGRTVAIDHDGLTFTAEATSIGSLKQSLDEAILKRTSIHKKLSSEDDVLKRIDLSRDLENVQFTVEYLQSTRASYERLVRSRPDVMDKLKATPPERWRQLLTPLIEVGEIDAFLQRRTELLEFYQAVRSGSL